MEKVATPARTATPAATLTPAPSRLLQRKCACGGAPTLTGECHDCNQKRLQRKASDGSTGSFVVPNSVRQVLQSPGHPLDGGTRSFMESRFGHDFSQVRVHNDAQAADSARTVNALAYTVGHDVVFGAGQYRPQTESGQRLLAHELAHTVQQHGMQHYSTASDLSLTNRAMDLELEADRVADRVVSMPGPNLTAPVTLTQHPLQPLIARQEADAPTIDQAPPATAAPTLDTTPPATAAPSVDTTATPAAPVVSGPASTAPTPATPQASATSLTVTGTPLVAPPSDLPAPLPAAGSTTAPAPTATPSAPPGQTTDPAETAPPPARAWQPIAGSPIAVGNNQKATQKTTFTNSSGTVAGFWIDYFDLPNDKGPVKDVYEQRASRGFLEAFLSPNATALWQSRAGTAELRNTWLLKVGWPTAESRDRWHAHGGPTPAADSFPRISGPVCQMDHIVELQLGGTNVPENIQVLDATPNQNSGRAIRTQLSDLARDLRNNSQASVPPGAVILLHFERVRGGINTWPDCASPGTATTCVQVEGCALRRRTRPGASGQTAQAGQTPTEHYPTQAGTTEADLLALPAPRDTDLLNTGPENLAASELIPGMVLQKLKRNPGASSVDTVKAKITSSTTVKRSRSNRLPITIEGRNGGEIDLHLRPREGRRHMSLQGNPEVRFTYPYLSRGNLRLSYSEERGLEGRGKLRPSLPLLNRAEIDVVFSNDEFRGSIQIPPRLLSLPGFTVTRSEIGVELAPVFRPYGVMEFRLGSIMDGRLTAEADTNGFVARGIIQAHLPNVDRAEGVVEYRGGQLSGFIVIQTNQIRIPGVRSGELRVDFDRRGAVPSGTIVVGLENGPEATLSVRRVGSRFIYSGNGRFTIPGLDPVNIAVTYDGEHFTGSASTGFTFQSLRGDITVNYRDGRISGQGSLQINRGRARGSITVRMNERRQFSGQGSITYQLTENLIGTIGIVIDERQHVRVNGELRFTQPIQLFRSFNNRRRLFRLERNIPIPGLSIGLAGVVARITGEMGMSYGIGPGELRDVHVTTAFDPLEDNPNLELEAGAQLIIPAHAGVSLTVSGGLGVSALIAEVKGNISATAELGLEGGLRSNITITYRQNRLEINAPIEISAHPYLNLRLDAYVLAQAGAFGLTVEKRWDWNLASWRFGSSWEFGLRAPLHYATGEGFTPPSLDTIQFIYPEISLDDLTNQIIAGNTPRSREGG